MAHIVRASIESRSCRRSYKIAHTCKTKTAGFRPRLSSFVMTFRESFYDCEYFTPHPYAFVSATLTDSPLINASTAFAT